MVTGCSIIYPERYTVQSPVLDIDQYGNTTVRYEPLELVSYRVTFPTGPWNFYSVPGVEKCSTVGE